MSSNPLKDAHKELNDLFERTQAALDPWASRLDTMQETLPI